MRKNLAYSLLALLISFSLSGRSQNIRFSHLWNHTDVGFNLNRLYNYNNYEHNRWGAGFYLITPLKYDSRYGTNFQNSFIADVYAGYGTGDHAWKYGGSAGLSFPRYIFQFLSVFYQHDLLRVGSHSFDEYNILNTSDNNSYFSSHYCGVDLISVNTKLDLPGPAVLWLGFTHSRERYLFNASNLLFPSIYDADALPYDTFDEAGLDLYWGDHWKFALMDGIRSATDNEPKANYFRLLAQYNNKLNLKNSHGQLSFFAQGGFVSENAPISRRFDLGGTGGGNYFFNNTFLTVRPNTFLADIFTLASIRYTAGRSLWKSSFSEPRLFLQLNAMWGMLYGKYVVDGTGIYNLLTGMPTVANQPNAIAFTAPYGGVLEPVAGFDKLLHLGLLDFGVAAAYQITPRNVSYHSNNFFDKFSVMCVAKLVFEYNL